MRLSDWYSITDKGYAHNLLGVYEKLLIGVDVKSILEIGVLNGESIRMWSGVYPKANVLGADINDTRSLESELDNVSILYGDAYSPSFLDDLGGKKFDVIVEDGSHMLVHQCYAAQTFPQFLHDGGVFFIEDIASIDQAHLIQQFIPVEYQEDSYIIDRRSAPCGYPYERFDQRNEILVVVDRRFT